MKKSIFLLNCYLSENLTLEKNGDFFRARAGKKELWAKNYQPAKTKLIEYLSRVKLYFL
jgi:hypothetical protein